jgi:hypothetical protein
MLVGTLAIDLVLLPWLSFASTSTFTKDYRVKKGKKKRKRRKNRERKKAYLKVQM